MEKPTKHAVSVVIKKDNKTLFALRSPKKKEFPLVWSLPSHFMEPGETYTDTIKRIGTYKLGVDLEPICLLNEGYGERDDFKLFMHDYLVKVKVGEPHICSDDYTQLVWEDAETFLPTVKVKGDCTRLYEEYLQEQLKLQE
ncbi:MAG: NUDIX domain-containing protein [Candidatus Saccharibacteria bacterium]|nr:NUDIX domain-containing protein [Candidatus Saccharibacteria bacterium]